MNHETFRSFCIHVISIVSMILMLALPFWDFHQYVRGTLAAAGFVAAHIALEKAGWNTTQVAMWILAICTVSPLLFTVQGISFLLYSGWLMMTWCAIKAHYIYQPYRSFRRR